VHRFGGEAFITGEPSQEDLLLARQALTTCATALTSGDFGMVIMDESITALSLKLLDLNELKRVISARPHHVELVMTGRNAPAELVEMADLVTEMREIKHYYRAGVPARKGIEF
jgi:cob(I)alamin adenosyltransferase